VAKTSRWKCSGISHLKYRSDFHRHRKVTLVGGAAIIGIEMIKHTLVIAKRRGQTPSLCVASRTKAKIFPERSSQYGQ
jgi:hypothetical protein